MLIITNPSKGTVSVDEELKHDSSLGQIAPSVGDRRERRGCAVRCIRRFLEALVFTLGSE
jgi:hypothetical protein